MAKMTNEPNVFTIQPTSNVRNSDKAQKKTKHRQIIILEALRHNEEKIFNESGCSQQSKKENDFNVDSEPKCSQSLYGLLCLLILTSAATSATLLPVHNAVINPDFWYEMIFSTSSTFFLVACCTTIGIETVLNAFKGRMVRVILDIFITFKIAEAFWISFIHFIWCNVLGYFEPFPYKWLVIYKLCTPVALTRWWKVIPLQKRMEPSFRKKYMGNVGCYLWNAFMSTQIFFIKGLLQNVQREMQWVIAMLLPLTKIVNDYVLGKLIAIASLSENLRDSKMMVVIASSLCYSIGFAILFTNVTKSTEFLLLGINFCINMSLVFKTISLAKRVSTIAAETNDYRLQKQKVVAELVLNETIEIIVPVAYIGSFLMAYYGPNDDVMGDVGCTIWKFEKADGLYSLIGVLKMALFDSISVVLAGVLLWKFSRINIFQEYCKTIKKYWIHVAFHGGSFLSSVSNLNCRTKIVLF